MFQLQNEGQNFFHLCQVASSLFTDNIVCKNADNKYFIQREPGSLYEKILGSKNEEIVFKYLEDACITHKNYAQIYSHHLGEDFKYRTISEATPYKLFDLISQTKEKRLAEENARYYLFQLIDVLERLHEKFVYYLTLRPEDVNLDEHFDVKLKDFAIPNAIIKCCANFEWVKDIFNKSLTLSPEVARKICISEKSDIFNLGVLVFTMVLGDRPFKEMSTLTDRLYRCISNNDHQNFWLLVFKCTKLELSTDFKDLVFKMLNVDHKKRIGLKEIKEHPWLSESIENLFKSVLLFNKNVATNKCRYKNNYVKKSVVKRRFAKLLLLKYLKVFFSNLNNND